MQLHFLRHATLILVIDGKRILADPMLSPKHAMEPVANAANTSRIPMVDLPITESELQNLIAQLDVVLVTHTHRDHWDARAAELLPKSIPLFTQPASADALSDKGFTDVRAISERTQWENIEISRTGGQHGTGEIGQKMGAVSGFTLRALAEPRLYLAGDTIWCAEVETALHTYKPDIVIVNAGAAQFLTGDPITMSAEDVCQVCRNAPNAKVVAVHMEAINHCGLTRAMLDDHLTQAGLRAQVEIPADGDQLVFEK